MHTIPARFATRLDRLGVRNWKSRSYDNWASSLRVTAAEACVLLHIMLRAENLVGAVSIRSRVPHVTGLLCILVNLVYHGKY